MRAPLISTAVLLLASLAAWPADPIPPRIDAHVHAAPPPEAFVQQLEALDMRLVNVTVLDPHARGFDTVEPQTSWAVEASRRSRGRIAWVASFDPAGYEAPDYAARTIEQLRSSFERGAIGVKVYKSVGLDLKSRSGRYTLPDDPGFAPVLEAIAAVDKTLMAHLGEPRSSWLPLDPADPHYSYYKNNPEWHMYQYPERPSHESIIAARDRMLAAHPKLRVIGCHLGSLEYDVDEIAKRLDRYPNFAVDTAARVPNLELQPRDKVRAFLIRYQDRVLWGTDLMELSWEPAQAAIERWKRTWASDWRYFATAERIDLGNGRSIQGLALPAEVLRKIFHDNALRWLPGLKSPNCCGDVHLQ